MIYLGPKIFPLLKLCQARRHVLLCGYLEQQLLLWIPVLGSGNPWGYPVYAPLDAPLDAPLNTVCTGTGSRSVRSRRSLLCWEVVEWVLASL